jgi:hypothetical protein
MTNNQPPPRSDARTRIVITAIEYRRPVVVNWNQRVSDDSWFPIVGLVIDGVRWSAFLCRASPRLGIEEHLHQHSGTRGLGRTLAAIAANCWDSPTGTSDPASSGAGCETRQ